MQKISKTIHLSLWLLIAMSVGIGAAVLLVNIGRLAYSYADVVSIRQYNQNMEDSPRLQDNQDGDLVIQDVKQYYMVGSAAAPTLSARSYIVADIETGDILASNARKVSYPIASVTKMMTAVVTKMLSPEAETVNISQRAIDTEGFRGGLTAGEELSSRDLLYPLLLVSSNDAAEALAEHFDRNNFMKQMNVQSKFIGMKNTYFDDPSGLSKFNTATADDLFTLLQYVFNRQPEILAVTSKDSVKASGHYWENKNRLKNFDPYFVGGKTGYTDPAKQTGVGIFEIPLSGDETRTLGIVILGSDNRENDVAKIIQYVQKHIHYGDQESIKSLYKEIEV